MPYNNTSMTREVPFNMMSTAVNPMMNSSSTVNDFSTIDLAQLMSNEDFGFSTFNIEPRSQEQVDFHIT